MKRHSDRLLKDFVLDDRRLEERHDVEVTVHWDDNVSSKHWPHGFAVPVLMSIAPLRFTFSDYKRFCTLDFKTRDDPDEIHQQVFWLVSSLVAYFTTSGHLPKQVGARLKSVRESLGLTELTVSGYIRVAPATLTSWEFGRRSPKGEEMYRWCHALGLVSPPGTALVRFVNFSPSFLQLLREDPERLRALTPDQFERFVAERLDRMGFNVRLTGATNRKDGGIDLIAVPRAANLGSVVLAGQVKHHRDGQKTGRDAVDRLLAWKGKGFGVGLLITNTAFTRDAIWAANRDGDRDFLRLRDFRDLKRWLEGHSGEDRDWREIPEKIELAPGIVVEIPKPLISTDFRFAEEG